MENINVKETSAHNGLYAVVDDGTREIPIYNKYSKLICNVYFRPADMSILDRYDKLMHDIPALVDPLKSINIQRDGTAFYEKDWPVIKGVENELKRRINELFDMDEADDIFRTRAPFSSVNGEFFCMLVIQAFGTVISQAIDEEAAKVNTRVSKYLSDSAKGESNVRTPADNA